MALSDVLYLLFLVYILPAISPVVNTASILGFSSDHEDYTWDNYHSFAKENPSVQHNSTNFLVNHQSACAESPFLVIIVCSNIMHIDRRLAIRETWGSIASDPHSRTLVLFFVGEPSEEVMEVNSIISDENALYKDIIQGDFLDTYRNLSLKSVTYLQWLDTYCRGVKFVLKTDDDMFINVPLLLHDLQNTVHQRFLMGNIIAGAQPMREKQSKWFTPESLFSGKMYPTYMSGTGYVISGDVVHDLFKSTQQLELFWLEDIYITGLCAKKAKLTHIFNGKFGYKQRSLDPCYLRTVITAHEVSVDELRNIWKSIKLKSLNCDHQNGLGAFYKS